MFPIFNNLPPPDVLPPSIPADNRDSCCWFLHHRSHNLEIEFASETVYDSDSTAANAFPFGSDIGTPGIMQIKYNKSMITESGIIDRIFFPTSQFSGDVVYENFTLRVAETPVEGELSHTDFTANYGEETPTTVIEAGTYVARNIGGAVILDFTNEFYYTGEGDLLFEFEWDSQVSGYLTVERALGAGAYRAWNLTWGGNVAGNDTRTYILEIEFAYTNSEAVYEGTALVNATQYFWRVRTMDSTGIWSPWATQSFKYEVLTTVPEFDNLEFTPDPGVVGESLTASIDATYFLGMEGAWFEIGGMNYSMSGSGDTFTYTWTPTSAGNFTYTIYMESSIGTWSSTSGIIEVVEPEEPPGPSLPIDTTTLLIIAGGVLFLIIIIVLLRKRGK